MAFVCLSDKVTEKSFTNIENKFITKYLPVLEPTSIKVYLYALYLAKSGFSTFTVGDLATALNMTEENAISYFEYLEEFELIKIISTSPFQIELCDCENIAGTPKKFKPEKYADFTKNAQGIIKGRMISTNEFREYFYLLEEYGFDQNALLMIISYCVNLKGDNIRFQYIKKVAKSFADDGAITAEQVNAKLSAYTSSTPALVSIFTAIGINRQPDVEDDKLYKKWRDEFGFSIEAIICAAKHFKAKTSEKLDASLQELYNNRKFDVVEIEDYCKNKNSIFTATFDIARALGVYMQNSAPYIQNYVNVWANDGFSLSILKKIADYCFKNDKKSFEDMHTFVQYLLSQGVVDEDSVNAKLQRLEADDTFILKLLRTCGLNRRIIQWDRDNLSRWREWGFQNEMLLHATTLACGKNNPIAYVSAILSSWKASGIYSVAQLEQPLTPTQTTYEKADVDKYYADLRHKAEFEAEKHLKTAMADAEYASIHKQLNALAIQLAYAEDDASNTVYDISRKIELLEKQADNRLLQLGLNKSAFIPNYQCKICNDTGYDKNGNPCVCLQKLLKKQP